MLLVGCPYSFSYPVINLLHINSIMNNYEFIYLTSDFLITTKTQIPA